MKAVDFRTEEGRRTFLLEKLRKLRGEGVPEAYLVDELYDYIEPFVGDALEYGTAIREITTLIAKDGWVA